MRDICQIMRRKQDRFSKEGLITVGVVRFSTVYTKTILYTLWIHLI